MHEKGVMEWHIVIVEMMRIAILAYQKVTKSKSDFPLHVGLQDQSCVSFEQDRVC